LGDIGLGTAIARGIAKIYIPAISLKAMKPQLQADAKLTDLFQNALRSYLENKLDLSLFADKTGASLMTDRSQINAQRTASHGTIKNFVLVGTETSAKNKIYRYKAETVSRIFLWRFELDETGKITALVLEEEE
ncbi:MAG TPA: hypothetical protein VGD05_11885, partial [Pyrinomonadaceae bacterium]